LNIILRIVLFLVSIGTLAFVLKRIRKSQVQIDSAIFWILFMLVLIIISIFPIIIVFVADILAIDSPANFVFLSIIFLLLLKVFNLSLQISKLQYQVQQLAQIAAIEKFQNNSDKLTRSGETGDDASIF